MTASRRRARGSRGRSAAHRTSVATHTARRLTDAAPIGFFLDLSRQHLAEGAPWLSRARDSDRFPQAISHIASIAPASFNRAHQVNFLKTRHRESTYDMILPGEPVLPVRTTPACRLGFASASRVFDVLVRPASSPSSDTDSPVPLSSPSAPRPLSMRLSSLLCSAAALLPTLVLGAALEARASGTASCSYCLCRVS